MNRDDIIRESIQNKRSINETQEILVNNNEPTLYSRFRRDTIFIWGLVHKRNIKEINQLCMDYNCKPLDEITNG